MNSGNTIGIIISVLMPFAVLALATVLSKFGASAEASRKIVHVLVSNWILIAFAVYRSPWTACILPAFFIVFNYFSATKGIVPAMERSKEESTLGTFWYAVSLFLLTVLGFLLEKPWAAASGMLAMGYGDGLAGFVGKRWGKHHFSGAYSQKSLEGTLAAMLFSGLSVGLVCYFYREHTSPNLFLYAAACCTLTAGVIELFTPRGLDNLSLPLGVALIVYLLDAVPGAWPALLSFNIGLLILFAGFYFRAITAEAFLVASVIGLLFYLLGGWLSFWALIVFFCVGSIVSVVGKKNKKASDFVNEHHGPRVIVQVLANGIPALLFAALYCFTHVEVFLLSVVICFAADTSDTFSSELGMLSQKQPVSILTLKPIQKGLSGGVTALGFAGAFLGSLIISLLAIPRFGVVGLILVIISGMFNSVLDSVLGAAFQAKYRYYDDSGVKYTEKPVMGTTKLELFHGCRWINNDMVNFISVLITGALFSVISYFCI